MEYKFKNIADVTKHIEKLLKEKNDNINCYHEQLENVEKEIATLNADKDQAYQKGDFNKFEVSKKAIKELENKQNFLNSKLKDETETSLLDEDSEKTLINAMYGAFDQDRYLLLEDFFKALEGLETLYKAMYDYQQQANDLLETETNIICPGNGYTLLGNGNKIRLSDANKSYTALTPYMNILKEICENQEYLNYKAEKGEEAFKMPVRSCSWF